MVHTSHAEEADDDDADDPLRVARSAHDRRLGRRDEGLRETLELDVPEANLLAAVYPDEPEPVADATEAARAALEAPISGRPFSEIVAGSKVAVIIDNQFRPTPQSRLLPAVFDTIEAAGKPAVVVCANGGLPDVRLGHRAEARARTSTGWSGSASSFKNDPRNTEGYSYVGVSSRGTPVWLHNEVAACDVKITIGQAQSNHWGAGGGGKLILPGVCSDETIESNHCAFVPSPQTHYGAYAGPMRSDIDEVATMCGLSCTMNVTLDTRTRHRLPLRLAP